MAREPQGTTDSTTTAIPKVQQWRQLDNSTSAATTSVADIIHIVKPFTGKEQADKWLKSFELYAKFKSLANMQKLDLF